MIELTNYTMQPFRLDVMFNIPLVLISIPKSSINDILTKINSLTNVWNLWICILSLKTNQ